MIPAPAHLNPHLTGLVHPASVFVADFLPVAPGFHHRTHHVRLRNLGTTDQKSSHKIGHRKFPGEHFGGWGVKCCFLVAVKISVAPDQGNTGPLWIKIRLLRRRYSDPSWGCRTHQWIKVPADGQRRSGQHIP